MKKIIQSLIIILIPLSTVTEANLNVTNKNIQGIVSDIVGASGLESNFTLIEVPNYNGAAAVIKNGKRIIVYDPFFLNEADRKIGSRWGSIGIMAHEVAHHLNAHTLGNSVSSKQSIDNELAADYFSGFMVQRLGGSRNEAVSPIMVYGTEFDTLTHPSKDKRLIATMRGWDKGCISSNDCKVENSVIVQSQPAQKVKSLDWSLSTLNNTQWNGNIGRGQFPIYAKASALLTNSGGVSVGAIDGNSGKNLLKAIAAFQQMNELDPTGTLDYQTWKKLESKQTEDAYITYIITKEDLNYPYITIPDNFLEKSKMKFLPYIRTSEMLAERFRMDEEFLKKLNPHAKFNKVGEKIIVANVKNAGIKEPISLLIVHKSSRQLFVFNSQNRMIAAVPMSFTNENGENIGKMVKVTDIKFNPVYDTSLEPNYLENLKGFVLPPGPNSPIGSVLISFDDIVFGIHGTSNPSSISKIGSLGEVRLTNWDALDVAKKVELDVTEVKFIE